MLKYVSAAALCAAVASFAPQAEARTINEGEATFTFDADLLASTYLTTNWEDGGVHSRSFSVRPSNSDFGTPSELDSDGAVLRFSGRGAGSVYLAPTDLAGEEVEDFADVKVFSFRNPPATVTEEMVNINYVPTSDPNVFTDFSNPSMSYTFTDEEVAALGDAQLRTCCRHTLSGYEIDTAAMTVDGIIDNVAERDVNFDGVIDEADEFHLFDLVATETENLFELALTETMASYLNFGFTPGAFADGSSLFEEWGALQSGGPGFLSFAGGDVVGNVSYSYGTVPVPAALPLLAGGLGLLGFVGRRKKRAA
ncbi:MAG: PEP-CTERM sorting domain-containing protein [Pseudooceanicola nanhaiensis]